MCPDTSISNLAAIHAHAITSPPPYLTDSVVLNHDLFLFFPRLFSSNHNYNFIWVSYVQRLLIPELVRLFKFFFKDNSNLAFLVLSDTSCLHLVANRLYLRS